MISMANIYTMTQVYILLITLARIYKFVYGLLSTDQPLEHSNPATTFRARLLLA